MAADVDKIISDYRSVAEKVAEREYRRRMLRGFDADFDKCLSAAMGGLWSGARNWNPQRKELTLDAWLAFCCVRAIRSAHASRSRQLRLGRLPENLRGEVTLAARMNEDAEERRRWYAMMIDAGEKFLEGNHREIFLHRFKERLTYDQIGKLMGFSRQGIQHGEQRALARLRQAIAGRPDYADINYHFQNRAAATVDSAGRRIDTLPMTGVRGPHVEEKPPPAATAARQPADAGGDGTDPAGGRSAGPS